MRKSAKHVYLLFTVISLCRSVHLQTPPVASSSTPSGVSSSDKLPPCAACRMLAQEFNKGLQRTRRHKFEGGDADYEKAKMTKYEDSEVRLIEIQEVMCEDIKKHSAQCRDLKEEHEGVLEDWFHNQRKTSEEGVEKWLCVETLKICCEKGYFGSECRPCAGGAKNPCSGRGTCRGSGSRKGNGTCKCNRGYAGDLCDKCSDDFYHNSTTEACEACDESCEGPCREGGPKGCLVCKKGYTHTGEWGCLDIDECLENEEPPCKGNTFCANNLGGYSCLDCDKSCDGCYSDGPDNCVKCSKGYVLNKGVCIQEKKRDLQVTLSRWAVHLGLIICTMIISKKNLTLSSIIGVCVAVYIGASKYTTGEWEDFDYIQFLKSFIVT